MVAISLIRYAQEIDLRIEITSTIDRLVHDLRDCLHNRIIAWFLAVQGFCHLVFVRMNPMSWVCIAITLAIWLGMAVVWWKAWKKERKAK